MDMNYIAPFKKFNLNEQLQFHDKNLLRKRYLLHTRKQVEGEFFEDYYKDLQCLFKLCEFKDDSILRDHIVFGIIDIGVREQLLEHDNPNLESVVEICRSGENKSFREGDHVKIESTLRRLPADNDERERTSIKFKDEDSLQDLGDHDYISSTFMEISGEPSEMLQPDVWDASAELSGDSDMCHNQMDTGRVTCASLGTAAGTQQVSISTLEPRDKCSRIKKDIKAIPKIIVMCNICNKALSSEQDLHSHMFSHSQSDETCLLPHPSQMIRMKSLNDAALRKQRHKDVCSVCNYTFVSSKDLSVHMSLSHKSVKPLEPSPLRNKNLLINSENTTIQCDLCVRTFSGKIAMRRLKYHKLNSHYTYICDHCNVQFLNRVALLSHIKKIYGIKLYTCKYCKKKFNRTFLYSHLRKVHKSNSKKNKKSAKTNTPIQCDLCVRTFSGKIAMRRLKYHKLNAHYTYICDHCNVQFLNRVALLSHIKKIFGVKMYTCKYCGKKFNRTFFHSHLRRIHGISSKKKTIPAQWCDICGSRFQNSFNLLKHRKSHIQEEHPCNICGYMYPSKPVLDRHVKYHGKFPCYLCDQVFETRRDFTSHMQLLICKASSKALMERTHSVKSYACDICHTIVSSREILKAHIDNEHNGISYTCDICHKIASTKAILRTHMDRAHSGITYTCDVCQKSVSSRAALKNHMLLHTGDRFECGICHKSMSTKPSLEIHMRGVHAVEKQFQCHFCSKTYAYRNSLQVHLLGHTKERPFCCDICSKSYQSKDYLKIHMRTHTGETPYHCDQCGKGFSVKSNLNRHLSTHNTERKYNCNVCNKSFHALHNLNIHIRYHTQIYKCQVCMKVFSFRYELRKHTLTHDI